MALSVTEIRAMGRAMAQKVEETPKSGLVAAVASARDKAEKLRAAAPERLGARARRRGESAAPGERAQAPSVFPPQGLAVWWRRFSAAKETAVETRSGEPVAMDAPPTRDSWAAGLPDPETAGQCPVQRAVGLLDRARRAGDDSEAAAFAAEAIELAPELAQARHILGARKLARGESDGVHHMIAAMGLDPRVARQAHGPVVEFLNARPDVEGAAGYLRSFAGLGPALAKADRERLSGPSPIEAFLPAGLSEVQIEAARRAFAREPAIAQAAVARRKTTMWPDLPAFIAVVDVKSDSPARGDAARPAVEKRLADAFAALGAYGTVCVLRPSGPLEKLVARRIGAAKGAWIYRAA
jgi:hypothetical protein